MKCLASSRRFQASWVFLRIFSPTKHPISTFSENHQLACVRSEFHDTVNSNKLISTHIRSGDLDSALNVFNGIRHKTVISWNSILSGYAKTPGKMREARQLFDETPEPDTVSYNTMLACHVLNAGILSAVDFFEKIPVKDAVSWNTMISGFARVGEMGRSREFFLASPVKNEVSWSAMISGYIECDDLASASELFDLAPVKSVVARTAMITGYMKFGKVESADELFRKSPEKNVVTWNAMISGYVRNCKAEEGLKLFRAMIGFGFKPNASTFSSALLGCSELSSLQTGMQVHQVIHKSPLRNDTTALTAIISMYCKCGALEDAQNIFLEMAQKDVVSWNAMITSYAQHGAGREALRLFNEMKRNGPKPNWVTFVAVLSACSHAGLVDVGVRYFDSMVRDYSIEVKPEHYTCMVDLLSRAGRLVEALDLVKKMPFKPEPAVFGALLSACRTHKNLELAEYAANNLLRFDLSNGAVYIQLANVYASVRKWDRVSEVWRLMKERKAVKIPGYSWIEINNAVHNFRSDDAAHPEISAIHRKLDELDVKMKRAGYTADLESALRDVTDEQKARHLLHHSERLAIAYGLLKLPEGTAVRVFKNLRICGDCHRAATMMSALEKREIIVRDAARFHHFRNGVCSCGGYW